MEAAKANEQEARPTWVTSKEGPLKEKVETTKFVYITGMTRQPYGVVRTVLRAAGVDTRKIYDVSFTGKQVGPLLTTNEYAAKVRRCSLPERAQ